MRLSHLRSTMDGMKRLLTLLLFALTFTATAQELRIGVVLPFSGSSGTEWQQVISGVERSIRLHPSPVMRNVEIFSVDDGGSPATAAATARQLLQSEDIHILICCTDDATARALQPVADELQLLTLSLATAPELPGNSMLKSLQPSPLSRMRALALGARRHQGDLSLLAAAGPDAEAVEYAFRAGAIEAGMPVMRVVTFASGTAPLTPEALLVATSQAEAIVVWADEADSREAVRSLRARGWTGPILLDYLQAGALAAQAGIGPLEFVVPPAVVTGGLPTGSGNQAAVSAWRVASGAALSGSASSLDGALLYDALQLSQQAFEQALVYGASLQLSSPQVRSALYDGLVGSGTSELAAGTYRYSAADAHLAQPAGLIYSSGVGGRFSALPAR